MRTLAETLNPATTALLVVDVQNDFCHPQGLLPRTRPNGATAAAESAKMAGPLAEIIASAREKDVLRVFIRAIYDGKYLGAPFAEKLKDSGVYGQICLEGSWGADYWAPFGVQPGPREFEVRKHRYTAFRDTDLLAILRAHDITSVIVTGVSTGACVDATVRDAFFNDFFVAVAADATASGSPDQQTACLQALSWFAIVAPVRDLLACWDAPAALSTTPD